MTDSGCGGTRRLLARALMVMALLLITGLSATAMAACARKEPAVYTEADNGATVQATVGDVITIRLSENPSTGYAWTFELSDGIERRTDTYVAGEQSPAVVGAPGTRELTLDVTEAGTQSVKGAYLRSWEGPDSAAERFSLTIEAGG